MTKVNIPRMEIKRFTEKRTIGAFQKMNERFLRIRGNPGEIALGLSLGLFIGMTPIMGLHMVLAVFLAALFKWNKISAAIGVWITNPFTAPIIYGINYFVGKNLLGMNHSFLLSPTVSSSSILDALQKTPEILVALTVGGAVTGIPLAVAGYYLSRAAIRKYRKGLTERFGKQKKAE